MKPILVVPFFSLCIFSFFSSLFAQRYVLRIDGNVLNGQEKLERVSIMVYNNGDFYEKAVTENNGKFRFLLDYDADYRIVFLKPGYLSKIVSVNTENVPEEDQDFGHEYGGWNLSLFTMEEGLDTGLFQKPFVKIYYNTEQNKFVHDAAYTEIVKKEFEDHLKDFEKKKKQELKRKKEEAKAAEKAAAEAAIKKQDEERKKAKESLSSKEEKANKKPESSFAPDGNNVKWETNSNVIPPAGRKTNTARRDTGEYKTKEDFLQALARLYPQGITEEIYMEGNVKITRRILVNGGMGTEYKMAEHPWGGRFWFKNEIPVNESVWNTETQ